MLELDCLYNNTSFWISLSTCEITYYLSTLSKRVRPLITLSFDHPKPTKGLDALSHISIYDDMSMLLRIEKISGFDEDETILAQFPTLDMKLNIYKTKE